MITFEILDKLEEKCYDLLNSTSGMIGARTENKIKKAHDIILKALRKIIVANEMTGKMVICISGLQGAGKSTMMKNFYGMSEEYFNITLGVGEKIPVFISEHKDLRYPEAYAVCLKKNDISYSQIPYSRYEVRMNPEDFIRASSGDVKQEVMYLELRVPYKHFNNENCLFMLLPGFEKKNDYWRSLIDFSVKCSDTSIFVFNESSFSKSDNQILLDKIHEKFGDSLIYAISQSDLSEDDNAKVKETCIATMKISKGEEDRVVCVGDYSAKEQNDKWIDELKVAVEKYCNLVETAHNNSAIYIYMKLLKMKLNRSCMQ